MTFLRARRGSRKLRRNVGWIGKAPAEETRRLIRPDYNCIKSPALALPCPWTLNLGRVLEAGSSLSLQSGHCRATPRLQSAVSVSPATPTQPPFVWWHPTKGSTACNPLTWLKLIWTLDCHDQVVAVWTVNTPSHWKVKNFQGRFSIIHQYW